MNMNIQAMMHQAKKMQAEIEKTQKEIEETLFTYDNNNILVECFGNNKIKKIVIKNKDILEDEEMLEDIVTVAVNKVLDDIKETKDKKLSKYANGLGGLF